LERNAEVIFHQGNLFIDFYEVLFVDGVAERSFNIELARIQSLLNLIPMIGSALLDSGYVFDEFPHVPRLVGLVFPQALLMDQIISIRIDVAGGIKASTPHEAEAKGTEGVEVLVGSGVGLGY
jgi:hypothetical protein